MPLSKWSVIAELSDRGRVPIIAGTRKTSGVPMSRQSMVLRCGSKSSAVTKRHPRQPCLTGTKPQRLAALCFGSEPPWAIETVRGQSRFPYINKVSLLESGYASTPWAATEFSASRAAPAGRGRCWPISLPAVVVRPRPSAIDHPSSSGGGLCFALDMGSITQILLTRLTRRSEPPGLRNLPYPRSSSLQVSGRKFSVTPRRRRTDRGGRRRRRGRGRYSGCGSAGRGAGRCDRTRRASRGRPDAPEHRLPPASGPASH